MPPTPIYLLEVVPLNSTGEQVATSLAGRLSTTQTAVAAIQAITDNLPNTGALTDISAETDKIDSIISDGLSGTVDSVAYRIHEIERHFHSYERWFGAATIPDGETHVGDRIGTTTAAFQTDAGNLTWGTWLQVLGSSDTPVDVGSAYFDLHRMQIVAVENANATHFVQVAYGASGAAALGAGTYTEFAFRPQSVQGSETIVNIHIRRAAVSTKTWVRHLTVGQNTSTMDFFIGLHEYEG
jgi:hypothetical protein